MTQEMQSNDLNKPILVAIIQFLNQMMQTPKSNDLIESMISLQQYTNPLIRFVTVAAVSLQPVLWWLNNFGTFIYFIKPLNYYCHYLFIICNKILN